MAKLTLSSLTSSYRSNAALNANFDAIEAAIENTLSRDGTSPNAMAANLDMGSNLIVNLADPVSAQDGATKFYVDSLADTIADINAITHADGVFIVSDGTDWVGESGVTARASMGVTIGTDVQGYDAGLASIAGLTTAADKMIYTTALDTYAVADLSSFARTVLDDATAKDARTTLEVNTKYVASISALKALTGGDFDMVDVGGHTTAGDGGGGLFRWDGSDTTTDDNGVYIQPDAGGTGRWIRQLDKREVDVRYFGAAGDGTGDDATAIQAAIDYAEATGNTAVLLSGYHNVGSTINITADGIVLRGLGTSLSELRPTFSSGDVLEVGDGTAVIKYVHLRDFTVDTPSAFTPRTAGASIKFNRGEQCSAVRVRCIDPFIGLEVSGADTTHVVLEDVVVRNAAPSTGVGILIDESSGGDVFLNYCSVNAPSGSQPLAGLRVKSSNALWIDNSDFINSGTGLLIDPGSGDVVTWLFAMNSAFDLGSASGIDINGGTGAVIRGLQFTGCWSSSNSVHGVRVRGTITPDGVHFSGHRALTNNQRGYSLEVGTNVTFDECKACGNSQTTADTDAGIYVAAGVSNWAVRDCLLGQGLGQTNDHSYGLEVASGAGDNFIITGNDFTNNGTAGATIGATGTTRVIRDNIGFAAEAEGTVSGTTNTLGDLIINHGLDVTPDVVTATVNGASTVLYCLVHAITSTNFRVRLYVGSGGSIGTAHASASASVNWRASGLG